MWSNLLVFHSQSKERDNVQFPGMFHWKTCMRTLYIGDSRVFDHSLSLAHHRSGYKAYEGYDAYRLVLEIISGLHSRLLGETEVLFQFKETFKNENLPVSAFGGYLQKLRDQLIEDSRKIRSRHLCNLGDQSYGGLAYRYLKQKKQISLIGTGQLAEQMLPWLLKTGAQITIYGRNTDRLSELTKNYSIQANHLAAFPANSESVVIAAPLSFQPYLQYLDSSMVIDFREDDTGDDFSNHNGQYISFAEMLNSLQKQEERNRQLREQLSSVVGRIVNDREYEIHHNIIYCWEDIHCYI